MIHSRLSLVPRCDDTHDPISAAALPRSAVIPPGNPTFAAFWTSPASTSCSSLAGARSAWPVPVDCFRGSARRSARSADPVPPTAGCATRQRLIGASCFQLRPVLNCHCSVSAAATASGAVCQYALGRSIRAAVTSRGHEWVVFVSRLSVRLSVHLPTAISPAVSICPTVAVC